MSRTTRDHSLRDADDTNTIPRNWRVLISQNWKRDEKSLLTAQVVPNPG